MTEAGKHVYIYMNTLKPLDKYKVLNIMWSDGCLEFLLCN